MTNNLLFGVISLGCAKNRIDTEEIISLFLRKGYSITQNLKAAHIIIVNTCAFIDDAREETLKTIEEVSAYKKEHSCRLLIIIGCFAETNREKILKRFSAVDLVIGVHGYKNIIEIMERSLKDGIRCAINPKPPNEYFSNGGRFLTTPAHSVYLKIAEGCNNRCSYCLIPKIRGPYRSRPLKSVIDEAADLVEKGALEINLVAQDTTYYGMEKGGSSQLSYLISEMVKIKKLKMIRILYAHPAHLEDDVIHLIATEKKVCSYIDLPIQHISERILKKMDRHYTSKRVIDLLKKLKSHDIAVRSTFITGFPGEEDEDFYSLIGFMKEYPMERLGVFKYSAEKGTAASFLKNHVPNEVKEKRLKEIISLQKKISFYLNSKEVGSSRDLLVDSLLKRTEKEYYYSGRTEKHAPEIDGGVIFSSKRPDLKGKIIKVNIVGSQAYDLIGIHKDKKL